MKLAYKHEYVRTDKNGTKYYKEWAYCSRCGGSGNVGYYQDNGICYKCMGSGDQHEVIVKEMTPEYAAQLEARRQAKYDERFAAARTSWIARKGFNTDGITYCILDREVDKEAVKALRGTWSPLLGWHAPVDMDQYKTVPVKVEDYIDDLGGLELKKYQGSYYCAPYMKEDDVVKDSWETPMTKENLRLAREALLKEKMASGEVNGFPFAEKARVQITANVTWVGAFDSAYGTSYVYMLRDASNNVYKWKSTRCIDEMYASAEGIDYKKPTEKEIVLAGTVKENSTYNGKMTTVLTRCKVIAA